MTTTVVTPDNAAQFCAELLNSVRVMRFVENENIQFRSARVALGKYELFGTDMVSDGTNATLALTNGDNMFSFPVEGTWEIDGHSMKVTNQYGTYHWVANPLW